jgi:hypothetical protein
MDTSDKTPVEILNEYGCDDAVELSPIAAEMIAARYEEQFLARQQDVRHKTVQPHEAHNAARS